MVVGLAPILAPAGWQAMRFAHPGQNAREWKKRCLSFGAARGNRQNTVTGGARGRWAWASPRKLPAPPEELWNDVRDPVGAFPEDRWEDVGAGRGRLGGSIAGED